MKINPGKELLHIQSLSTLRSQTLGPQDAFADLLKARMAGTPAPAPSPVAPSARGFIPLSGVQLTVGSSGEAPAALTGAEQLLDLMERYRFQLADRSSSLHQISPTVRRMAEILPSLEAACECLPTEDELRQTVTQAMVTARMEIMRFAGGQYNGE